METPHLEEHAPPVDDAAHWYPIPQATFVAVEHPYIVKNIENGVRTLGGYEKLGKVSNRRSSSFD